MRPERVASSHDMKAAAFEYSRPGDVEEACALLAGEDGARIIAGGQTLVPMMAMRLSRPTRLVDIGRIAALSFIREDADGVCIGATTRQCVVEHDPLVAARVPLLAAVIPWIGHAATRARGTIGGSLANADPAAELVLIAITLDATLKIRDTIGCQDILASDFFIGPMITTLPAASCLTGVCFPAWREGRIGVGFHEVSARRSDFASVSVAAQVAIDESGVCRRIAVGIGAATDVPIRLASVERALAGTHVAAADLPAMVTEAMAGVETLSDLHASADYRRRVAASLAVRAIEDALTMANARDRHAR